jgi:hypothetical protein
VVSATFALSPVVVIEFSVGMKHAYYLGARAAGLEMMERLTEYSILRLKQIVYYCYRSRFKTTEVCLVFYLLVNSIADQ